LRTPAGRSWGAALVLLIVAVNLVVCLVLWMPSSTLPSAAPPTEPANAGDDTSLSPAPIQLPSLPKSARQWQKPSADPADFFVIPYDATLYLAPVVGGHGGPTEFGIILAQGDLLQVFTGLPGHPHPASEIEVGDFTAGSRLRVYLRRGDSWAFSDSVATAQSRETFSDRDNSLGGRGSIIEKTGSHTWVLHMDDIDSDDDDDSDILIQVRLGPSAG
jgi:hypothetical protein